MQYSQRPPERKPQEPSEDARIIAYFKAQRKEARSCEWAACLDAMIRDLEGELQQHELAAEATRRNFQRPEEHGTVAMETETELCKKV